MSLDEIKLARLHKSIMHELHEFAYLTGCEPGEDVIKHFVKRREEKIAQEYERVRMNKAAG